MITFLYPDKNVLDLYFQSIEYLIFINFLFNFYIKFYFVNVTPPQTYFAKKNARRGGSYLDVYGILNILFCSSLLSVLISNDYFYIPIIGETSFTSQSFCIFLLVFSWLGMKSLNIFIFPILALLTLGRIGEVNKAMGIVGLFYLMFAYISIFLQLSDNKKIKQLYKISLGEFTSDFQFDKNPDENNSQNYESLLDNNQ